MIRRSVRAKFHTVYWTPPETAPQPPSIFYANHHGWMDGYLMFHLVEQLGMRSVDWIEEFEAFPLFKSIGGMPFPNNDAAKRANTIRQTIRLMKTDRRSLVIFPEGVLHRPPDVMEFGKGLSVVAKAVPEAEMVPVALRYEISMHERPEAWITVGKPHAFGSLDDCRERVESLLRSPRGSDVLVAGTKDVNERMDMRRIKNG